ncbi:MAG: lipoprotein insertase outer membrane protein LolB [Candidatus Accumulibacter sp.]|jgi:outer membrane lipoprotein LolB|nr:lipoprotein insertase outer membrane protein LolB [Accumulibacter sp.]
MKLPVRWRAAFFLCAALLAGCAEMSSADRSALPPRHALEAFLLEGRFSLRQGEQNHSGRLSWRHTADGDELLLASPFGQGIAEIVATSGHAALTTGDGKVFAAPDVPSLTEEALGYRLPLTQISDWVRARAVDAEVLERDALGRPLRLRRADWRVEYAYDGDNPEELPASVFVERVGAFELRLRIDEWSALPVQENTP